MKLKSARFLDNRRINYRIIELKEKAISVEDVIKYSKEKIDSNEICKTILLKDKDGLNYAMFLIGNHRIDFSKVKRIIGKKVDIMSYEEVKKVTGIELGAICPILLEMPIFIDKRVFERTKINFGSGDHLYGLEMSPRDLSKIIDFKIVDIIREAE